MSDKNNIINTLFNLHNKLAGVLLDLCKDCKSIQSYSYPTNYTQNVIELKNKYVKGFKREELKGCCKFEPLRRFHNLLSTFPYQNYIKPNASNELDILWNEANLTNKLLDDFMSNFTELINNTCNIISNNKKDV
jgi:hypothetical protein